MEVDTDLESVLEAPTQSHNILLSRYAANEPIHFQPIRAHERPDFSLITSYSWHTFVGMLFKRYLPMLCESS